MTSLFLLSLLSLGEVGNGSVFSLYGDPYNPSNQPLACEGRIIKRHGRASFRNMLSYGIAHRTLPCGSQLTLCIQKRGKVRCSKAYVIDRGPYGVVYKKGKRRRWKMYRKLPPGKQYRGIVDVLSPLAQRLKVTGIFSAYLLFSKSSSARNK